MLLGLNTYVLISRLISIAYIAILWYKTHWYVAIAVLAMGIIVSVVVGSLIEKKIGNLIPSLLGFILIPILAWLMFRYTH